MRPELNQWTDDDTLHAHQAVVGVSRTVTSEGGSIGVVVMLHVDPADPSERPLQVSAAMNLEAAEAFYHSVGQCLAMVRSGKVPG